MAATTTKTVKATTAKTAPAKASKPVKPVEVESITTVEEVLPTEPETAKIVPKDVDTSQMVIVRNGFQGALIYISSKTGEIYRWSEFGAEQEMELKELRNAKASAKGFFTKNWFLFNDEDMWVIDWLGLGQYYKNALKIDEFDDLFNQSHDEIAKRINALSEGQKRSLTYRARTLVADGTIDSKKLITMLEELLNTELVEH